MFTGLIRDIGVVVEAHKSGADTTFILEASKLPASALSIGASICCNGACLTITQFENQRFTVMASAETLSKTTLGQWQKGTKVNLEPALRMGDPLDGHIVSGHVDGVAECVGVKPEGQSLRFSFRVPADLAPFIAPKGSVAVDGVSLTVNEVQDNVFGINIIPHTLQHTSFGELREGGKVNIEIDMLARYVARMSGFNR